MTLSPGSLLAITAQVPYHEKAGRTLPPLPQTPPGVYLLLGGDCPSSLPFPRHPLGAGPELSWPHDRVTGLGTSGPPAHSCPLQLHVSFSCWESLICQDRPCIAGRGCVESTPILCALHTSFLGSHSSPCPSLPQGCLPLRTNPSLALPSCFPPQPSFRPTCLWLYSSLHLHKHCRVQSGCRYYKAKTPKGGVHARFNEARTFSLTLSPTCPWAP